MRLKKGDVSSVSSSSQHQMIKANARNSRFLEPHSDDNLYISLELMLPRVCTYSLTLVIPFVLRPSVFLFMSLLLRSDVCTFVKCPRSTHCVPKLGGKKIYECKCKKSSECPDSGIPVCGSDGRTYPNECKLLAEACKNEQAGQHGGLIVVSEEQCSKSFKIF